MRWDAYMQLPPSLYDAWDDRNEMLRIPTLCVFSFSVTHCGRARISCDVTDHTHETILECFNSLYTLIKEWR
jgi:hypothetical protein